VRVHTHTHTHARSIKQQYNMLGSSRSETINPFYDVTSSMCRRVYEDNSFSRRTVRARYFAMLGSDRPCIFTYRSRSNFALSTRDTDRTERERIPKTVGRKLFARRNWRRVFKRNAPTMTTTTVTLELRLPNTNRLTRTREPFRRRNASVRRRRRRDKGKLL